MESPELFKIMQKKTNNSKKNWNIYTTPVLTIYNLFFYIVVINKEITIVS